MLTRELLPIDVSGAEVKIDGLENTSRGHQRCGPRAGPPLPEIPRTIRGFIGSRPSRCIFFRASFRARRIASAFSRIFLFRGLLEMAAEVRRLGMRPMVGCMEGTSLSVAPALIVGQLCSIVDLDGPIFLKEDREPKATYENGTVYCAGGWGSPASPATTGAAA